MKRRLFTLCLIGLGLCLGAHASAEAAERGTTEPLQISSELADLIEPLIAAHRGDVGVAIKHLGSGVGFVHREAEPMPTASLIKLALMVTAYHQVSGSQLQLDQLLPLSESDKVPGSGILTPHFSAGTQLTLRDAIRLMIAYSDNTATNLVIDAVGLASTAERMLELGFPNTKLHSKVYRRETSIFPERSQRFGLGSTTAAETIALLEEIDRGTIISRDICDQILEHLYACEDRDKLVRLLPSSVRVAHKSGYVSQSRVDAGLIDGPDGRIAICVLTDRNADHSASDQNEASLLIANIAATTFQFFYRVSEASTSENVDSPAATTDAAGRDGDESLASPTAEVFGGPPVVSCRAWAIGDGRSGELLHQHQASQKLDNASTTKLMTAWLIAKLAKQYPEILDEELIFSQRADKTIGSTAGVNAGEKLRVGDLLYGLLLPSGNDAAVAFAEHFGSRLRPSADEVSGDGAAAGNISGDEAASDDAALAAASYKDFIAAMNREAAELGLKQTSYKNPHGLTAQGHGCSAADLIKLAHRVLDDPLLSKVVSTRRYRCDIVTPDGATRPVSWNNTNQLLAIDGYDGAKTGTTTAAGACLVASGNRDGKRLIVVILGASGSEARYADARNLFRWAWQQPNLSGQ